MSVWSNTPEIADSDAGKPCRELGWCPHGCLVEEFGRNSCEIFGYDCPASSQGG